VDEALMVNLVAIWPPGIATEEGIVKPVAAAEIFTRIPPEGATEVRKTAQEVEVPAASGPVHEKESKDPDPPVVTCAVIENATLLETPPAAAVTVAVPVGAEVAAETEKVAVVAPAATSAEPGTVTPVPATEIDTGNPLAGAAIVSVAVQEAERPAGSETGLQASVDNLAVAVAAPVIFSAVDFLVVAEAAETVAVSVGVDARVETEKLPEATPAGIEKAAETETPVAVVEGVIGKPPVGAAEASVTVQVEDCPALRLAGLQVTPDNTAVVSTFNEPFLITVPACAAIVAISEGAEGSAEAVKSAEVMFAGTLSDAGTLTPVAVVESDTETPPAYAGEFSDTVQVVDVPALTVAGLHKTDKRMGG
jgi:hypothetical protein